MSQPELVPMEEEVIVEEKKDVRKKAKARGSKPVARGPGFGFQGFMSAAEGRMNTKQRRFYQATLKGDATLGTDKYVPKDKNLRTKRQPKEVTKEVHTVYPLVPFPTVRTVFNGTSMEEVQPLHAQFRLRGKLPPMELGDGTVDYFLDMLGDNRWIPSIRQNDVTHATTLEMHCYVDVPLTTMLLDLEKNVKVSLPWATPFWTRVNKFGMQVGMKWDAATYEECHPALGTLTSICDLWTHGLTQLQGHSDVGDDIRAAIEVALHSERGTPKVRINSYSGDNEAVLFTRLGNYCLVHTFNGTKQHLALSHYGSDKSSQTWCTSIQPPPYVQGKKSPPNPATKETYEAIKDKIHQARSEGSSYKYGTPLIAVKGTPTVRIHLSMSTPAGDTDLDLDDDTATIRRKLFANPEECEDWTRMLRGGIKINISAGFNVTEAFVQIQPR